ncbi:hypothetical protein PoB_000829100 [Plakobranchus ocellatus]|uniref:Uncharacterized protein n=1 Tax=Plakobranchus ocellatus TaxID=259542 RepID=A0AAV3Y3F1_9GAST|nr:hypothetical protein PoB_000829100 [Plakobranchus ocellatus]
MAGKRDGGDIGGGGGGAERRKMREDVRYAEVSGGKGSGGKGDGRKVEKRCETNGVLRGRSRPGVVTNNTAMLAV